MQFELPRYIEEEAKILGPLNIKQFFIMFAGIIACALFFFFFRAWLATILSVILMLSVAFLMFGKIQGKQAYTVALAAVRYFWQPKAFVWKKDELTSENIYYESTRKEEQKQPEPEQKEAKILSLEEIQELAKKLDKKEDKEEEIDSN